MKAIFFAFLVSLLMTELRGSCFSFERAGRVSPVLISYLSGLGGSIMVVNRNWVLYILECCDGTLYTGITNDLCRRLSEHQSGTGAKYTKGRSPVKLIYPEEYGSRSDASKREVGVKRMSRGDILLLAGSRDKRISGS